MRYVTGIHALNLPCALDTCGDWHASAIQWAHPMMGETDGSVFGGYGIEVGRHIPDRSETFCVANHIRALLDMLEMGDFAQAQGMRRDFICNDAYDEEIFQQAVKLASSPRWGEIARFMHKEYGRKWRLWSIQNGAFITYDPPRHDSMTAADSRVEREIPAHGADRLMRKKCIAFMARDEIHNLFDICYMGLHHRGELSATTISMVANTISEKGIEQFDYLAMSQMADSTDRSELASSFLALCDTFGILLDLDERDEIVGAAQVM